MWRSGARLCCVNVSHPLQLVLLLRQLFTQRLQSLVQGRLCLLLLAQLRLRCRKCRPRRHELRRQRRQHGVELMLHNAQAAEKQQWIALNLALFISVVHAAAARPGACTGAGAFSAGAGAASFPSPTAAAAAPASPDRSGCL